MSWDSGLLLSAHNQSFFIEFRPRNALAVKWLWDTVDPIIGESEEADLKEDDRLEKCGHTQCCTGFMVNDDSRDLKILTFAHVLGLAFNQKHPITAARINSLYDTMVLCDHEERRCQSQQVENEKLEKTYMTAQVVWPNGSIVVSCYSTRSSDLLSKTSPSALYGQKVPREADKGGDALLANCFAPYSSLKGNIASISTLQIHVRDEHL